MMDIVEFYFDFKSLECFCFLDGLEALVRDYKVSIRWKGCVAESWDTWEKHMDDKCLQGVLGHFDKAAVHKSRTNLCLAQLMGIGDSVCAIGETDPRLAFDSTLALQMVRYLDEHHCRFEEILGFVRALFHQIWCGKKVVDYGELEKRYSSDRRPLEKPSSKDIYRVPGLVVNVGQQRTAYLGLENLSLVRYRLDALKRSNEVKFDHSFAYSPLRKNCSIHDRVVGMPGTKPWLFSRYDENSRTGKYKELKQVECWIDIKSPHVYLAIEMTRAMEQDFNIAIRWCPFHLPIDEYLGSSTKPKDENKDRLATLPETRTPEQWIKVKYLYRQIRELSQFSGLTIRGTEKVFDSHLSLLGMLYALKFGRLYLDRYFDLIFPPTWNREANIESMGVIKSFLTKAAVPMVEQFDSYAKDEGWKELEVYHARARELGVFGVPTYVVDKDVLFGKEWLSVIRLKLYEQGLMITGEENIDVPYLWRPSTSPKL